MSQHVFMRDMDAKDIDGKRGTVRSEQFQIGYLPVAAWMHMSKPTCYRVAPQGLNNNHYGE
jgi:hypothetical protein